jgi:2'-5' RNA ligase
MAERTYPVPKSLVATGAFGGREHATAAQLRQAVTEDERAWANRVLSHLDGRKAQALSAAAVGEMSGASYYGLLHPDMPDHEVVFAVTRVDPSCSVNRPMDRWNGREWEPVTAAYDPVGFDVVELDTGLLPEVLEALSAGAAGVVFSPLRPKAWTRPNTTLASGSSLVAAAEVHDDGIMVAFYPPPEWVNKLMVEGGQPPEDLHMTLAYLGSMADNIALPDAVSVGELVAVVVDWAMDQAETMTGSIAGPALFTEGEQPVSVALVDVPALPEARQQLVEFIESAGFAVRKDHGYTPHITLAYDGEIRDVPTGPISFDRVCVVWGTAKYEVQLGDPMRELRGYGLVNEAGEAYSESVVAAYGGTAIATGEDALAEAPPGSMVVAVVDDMDTSAVLDVIRVEPGPRVMRRHNGAWEPDNEYLAKLIGVDPPTVMELEAEQLTAVLEQVDQYDQENPDPEPEETTEPVTAAYVFTESKHERDASGKFESKGGGGGGGAQAGRRRIRLKATSKPGPRPIPESNQIRPTDRETKPLRRPAPPREISGGPARPNRPVDDLRPRPISTQPGLRPGPFGSTVDQQYWRRTAFEIADAEQALIRQRERDAFDREIKDEFQQRIAAGEEDIEEIEEDVRQRIAAEIRRREAEDREAEYRLSEEEIQRMREDSALSAAADKPASTRMPGDLMSYWSTGKGAFKIRWGTSGDFNRCRRQLAKYLRTDQVSGACANLHRIATGRWPGRNRGH